MRVPRELLALGAALIAVWALTVAPNAAANLGELGSSYFELAAPYVVAPRLPLIPDPPYVHRCDPYAIPADWACQTENPPQHVAGAGPSREEGRS